MLKKSKKSKGFTLVELLAVIVVLAIIMVIATQQVNRTIKKARTNSFIETMESTVKSAKLLIAESSLSQGNLRKSMDYSENEYQICFGDNGTQSGTITIVATGTGKFNNIDFTLTTDEDKRYFKDAENKSICTYINDNGEVSIPTDAANVPIKECPPCS